MKEKEIQNILAVRISNQRPKSKLLPNVYFGKWEADLLEITKSSEIHEYEIKDNLEDFKREVKNKEQKHISISQIKPRTPNKFTFVINKKILIRIKKIPDLYGIITIENGKATEIKKAQRIHSKKITEREQIYLISKIHYKYWKKRLNDK